MLYSDIVLAGYVRTFFMFYNIKKLIGLGRRETSVVGKWALALFKKQEIRHALSLILITLFVSVILARTVANTGGSIAFAAQATAPKDLIDATTMASVQSPIAYNYESRGFSWFHTGADLAVETGTPVYPIMVGTVKATNFDYFGYGIHVIVEHFAGYESLYAHLSKINVKIGQKVGLQTELGKSGSTGFSTGPHLHLEIHQNGQLIDPADLVPGIK